MNATMLKVLQMNGNPTLTKALYAAEQLHEYFRYCFVCELETDGYSFRFMLDPEWLIDIDIYHSLFEDVPVVLLERKNNLSKAWDLPIEEAVSRAKEIMSTWKQ